MAIVEDHKKTLEKKLVLSIMSQIENTPEISQRALSSQLGIAIGLVNNYLKRCVQKGWIKIQHVPTRRYAYYMTPRGFIEKAKLSVQYLSSSFIFFRDAQNQLIELYEQCARQGWHRIILIGVGDLSEVALLVTKKMTGTATVVVVPVENFEMPPHFDCVIITDMCSPQKTFESLLKKIPAEKILTPSLLHISRQSFYKSKGNL